MSNELVDLMLYHGRSEGLFAFPIARMHERYQSSGFTTSSWLPLYEVERRAWDNAPAFRKLGTAADQHRYYRLMQANNVEFYVTDQERFEVPAFDGWGLTAQSFEPPGFGGFEWDDLDFAPGDEDYD